MRILVGCEMTYEFPQPTPVIATLNVHASRFSDLERPDYLITSPTVPLDGYRDSFGNWCNRMVAPAGRFTLKTDTVVRDHGSGDTLDPDAQEIAIEKLPSDNVLFLLGSRYCETDRLSDIAWDLFGHLPPGWSRVQAICDYVHDRSPSGTNMRVRPARLSTSSKSDRASAATTRIWRSPSVAASTFRPATATVMSATSACPCRTHRATSRPGWRSISAAAGTPLIHATTARVLAGS